MSVQIAELSSFVQSDLSRSHSLMFLSHFEPIQPISQLHLKLPKLLTHEPCLHGKCKHSLMSSLQSWPVRPVAHLFLKAQLSLEAKERKSGTYEDC